jgi:hypothetical protein
MDDFHQKKWMIFANGLYSDGRNLEYSLILTEFPNILFDSVLNQMCNNKVYVVITFESQRMSQILSCLCH